MVGDQEYLPGVAHDGLRGPYLIVVVIEQRAVLVDAADADHGVVDAELGNHVVRGLSDHATITIAYRAAGDDDAESRVCGQQQGDVEIVRDEAQILVIQQLPRYRLRRRADIDEEGRVRRDVLRNEPRDAPLLVEVEHLARRVVDVLDARGKPAPPWKRDT